LKDEKRKPLVFLFYNNLINKHTIMTTLQVTVITGCNARVTV
jgi:hypothetical protein